MADQATGTHFLATVIAEFRKYKTLAERALEQLGDEDIFATIGEEDNSIAIIMKHVAGNLRSRWTDFLTTDGEKPDRDRDSEFVMAAGTTAAELMRWWEDGWRCVFAALEPLSPDDLQRTVYIRALPHTVVEAISRSLTHIAYHVGQIVLLAKHRRGAAWKSLSIPKGQSAAVNAAMMGAKR
jgi:hypothetical protein